MRGRWNEPWALVLAMWVAGCALPGPPGARYTTEEPDGGVDGRVAVDAVTDCIRGACAAAGCYLEEGAAPLCPSARVAQADAIVAALVGHTVGSSGR